MNTFTASNGVKVEATDAELIIDLYTSAPDADYLTARVTGDHIEALREFFRAEEDERLNRWRWPEDPDYVVYEPRDLQPARVLRESTSQILNFHRNEHIGSTPSAFGAAAAAYFDAHPEPKPWHDAKPGEVWLLRIPTGPTFDHAPAVVSSSANGNVIFTAATYDAAGTEELALTAAQITYATRIYPEGVAS